MPLFPDNCPGQGQSEVIIENWWISWKMSEIKSAELLREAERRRMVYRGSRRVKKRDVFLKLLNRVGKVLILKFGL